MSGWLYALLCLVLPVGWALIVVWATNRIESWRRTAARQSGDSGETAQNVISPEYHI